MVGENPGEMEDEVQYILITAIVAGEWAMDMLPIRVVPRSFFVPYFWDEEAFLVQINLVGKLTFWREHHGAANTKRRNTH